MPKIALVFICTGTDYWKYLQPAIDGAAKFFPADILLLTDSPKQYNVANQVYLKHQGWPDVTLLRYHAILRSANWLAQYDYVFYLDIDMRIVRPISDEILADGITVVLHPSFVGTAGTPEIDPASTACLLLDEVKQYVMGCFQGGTTKDFLAMAKEIAENIDKDRANGFTARWHDESHLNRYIHTHPPAKILTPAYACRPTDESVGTYIVTIDKGTPDRPAVNLPLDEAAFAATDDSEDLKKKLNRAIEKLVRLVLMQKKRIDVLEERIALYNTRAGHRI